jgi:poly(hydroxyalkanoate) depolymerase family esterase
MPSSQATGMLASLRAATRHLLARLRLRAPQPAPVPPSDRLPTGTPAAARGRMPEFGFSSPAGSRSYALFVPSRTTEGPRPLLVMLHGCRQTPDDFATGTRMNAYAERRGVVVAYPAQSKRANRTLCWNWFHPADQCRDRGEAAIIAELTLQLADTHGLDRKRLYLAGLSAGGAMALAVTTAYPEIYAAVGVHSGIPAGVATGLGSAMVAMRRGSSHGSAPRTPPQLPLIVFHGDADHSVDPQNGRDIFGAPGGAREVATESPTTTDSYACTRIVRSGRDPSGDAEFWLLQGAGHAWSGGDSHGSFADPRGPSASAEMLRFFLAHARADAR